MRRASECARGVHTVERTRKCARGTKRFKVQTLNQHERFCKQSHTTRRRIGHVSVARRSCSAFTSTLRLACKSRTALLLAERVLGRLTVFCIGWPGLRVNFRHAELLSSFERWLTRCSCSWCHPETIHVRDTNVRTRGHRSAHNSFCFLLSFTSFVDAACASRRVVVSAQRMCHFPCFALGSCSAKCDSGLKCCATPPCPLLSCN